MVTDGYCVSIAWDGCGQRMFAICFRLDGQTWNIWTGITTSTSLHSFCTWPQRCVVPNTFGTFSCFGLSFAQQLLASAGFLRCIDTCTTSIKYRSYRSTDIDRLSRAEESRSIVRQIQVHPEFHPVLPYRAECGHHYPPRRSPATVMVVQCCSMLFKRIV